MDKILGIEEEKAGWEFGFDGEDSTELVHDPFLFKGAKTIEFKKFPRSEEE